MAEQQRPLSMIAEDIRENWPDPWPHAVPFIEKMATINAVTDDYLNESAKSVVLYFLANAMYWRGPEATRIKAELRAMTS
jgi:hypothetical protein